VVEYVDWAGSRIVVSAVVIDRAMVRAGREAVMGLADLLEGPAPVSPRGVALARTLLFDGIRSPLFNANCGRTVAEAAWEVADTLCFEDPTMSHPCL
jgi:hypothetical protein